jgi:hypothetical protein
MPIEFVVEASKLDQVRRRYERLPPKDVVRHGLQGSHSATYFVADFEGDVADQHRSVLSAPRSRLRTLSVFYWWGRIWVVLERWVDGLTVDARHIGQSMIC